MAIRVAPAIKHLLLYSASLALGFFLLQWLEWKLLLKTHATDLYIGAIALLFTLLGIWLAQKLTSPRVKTVVLEKLVYPNASDDFQPDAGMLEQCRISKREYEVLQLMSEGLSNEAIAGSLFLSLSTVKTHASNLFVKLDVKSRTQAIQRAKQLRILP